METDNSVAGFLGAVYDPAWFVAQQIPQEKPLVASENSIVLAHQLGNLYLGMCLVGLSLFWSTSEIKVIRSYLVALLIADAGHVGFTWYGMGSERFFDVSGWNAMAWGNLGATVSVSSSFLFHFFSLGVNSSPIRQEPSRETAGVALLLLHLLALPLTTCQITIAVSCLYPHCLSFRHLWPG